MSSTGSYEVPLFDTQYVAELLPGLRAGAYGASFRFKVEREDLDQNPKRSTYNPNGLTQPGLVQGDASSTLSLALWLALTVTKPARRLI